MPNSTVTAQSEKSDPDAPARPDPNPSPSPSPSPSSIAGSFAWAEGRKLLSQGVGSQLELVKVFTATSGFWSRWFRYLVLLALAARVLHHGARLFKHYGHRLFRAAKRLGGWGAKSGGDGCNGGESGREVQNRNQGPPGVCTVCRTQLSPSSQETPLPRLLHANRPQPLFDSPPSIFFPFLSSFPPHLHLAFFCLIPGLLRTLRTLRACWSGDRPGDGTREEEEDHSRPEEEVQQRTAHFLTNILI
ncbi:hypothetical protein PG993_007750 [Apiospora rasikravindrae]|uniref:Uncharacterized protein n=1 Tax=Apiospora rasikravindrae TaxID=990691 RepID=A0ABR1SYD8_9PEZI